MPRSCCVPCCFSYQGKQPNLSWHRFPSDPERKKKWLAKIRRDVGPKFRLNPHTLVCSTHFRDEDFRVNRFSKVRNLKDTAVPTLFSWTSGEKNLLKRPQDKPLNGKLIKSRAKCAATRSQIAAARPLGHAEENVTASHEEPQDTRNCHKYARSHTMATRVIPGNVFSLGREVVIGNNYKTATLVNDLQSTVQNILTGAVTVTISHANGFGGSTWVIRGSEEDPIVTVRYKNDFHCPFRDSGDNDQSNIDQEPTDESSHLKSHTFGHANLQEVITLKENARLEPCMIKAEALDFSSRQDSSNNLTVSNNCASSEGDDHNLRVPRCGGVLSSAAVGNVCESFFNAADETFVVEHEGKDALNIDDFQILSKNKASAPPELVAKHDGSLIDSSATDCIRGSVPNVDEHLKLSVESTCILKRQRSAASRHSTHETLLTEPGVSKFDEQKAHR